MVAAYLRHGSVEPVVVEDIISDHFSPVPLEPNLNFDDHNQGRGQTVFVSCIGLRVERPGYSGFLPEACYPRINCDAGKAIAKEICKPIGSDPLLWQKIVAFGIPPNKDGTVPFFQNALSKSPHCLEPLDKSCDWAGKRSAIVGKPDLVFGTRGLVILKRRHRSGWSASQFVL